MGNRCKTSLRKLFIIGSIMIGQKSLLSKIDILINSYPKFSIITGPKGSGKRTIANYICNRLVLPIMPFGTSIEEVRNVIDQSYDFPSKVCYLCADADSMSLGAKNALLKITEEPPQNVYFILTLLDMSNTLETIKSRGMVLPLDSYSKEELLQYRQLKNYDAKFDNIVTMLTNIGEVDELFKYDVKKFYKYAETVAFQIHIPTSGNILVNGIIILSILKR